MTPVQSYDQNNLDEERTATSLEREIIHANVTTGDHVDSKDKSDTNDIHIDEDNFTASHLGDGISTATESVVDNEADS